MKKLYKNANKDDPFSMDHIPIQEMHMAEEFLDKFVFISESSSVKEEVNIKLALKALPVKISMWNIYRLDLINFNLAQRSLIAF